MKEIILEQKMTYKEMVEFINNNFTIEKATKFIFTKIVETNAKMRKLKKFKNIYSYEVENSVITLNDENHKQNLFNKVCFNHNNYSNSYYSEMGID